MQLNQDPANNINPNPNPITNSNVTKNPEPKTLFKVIKANPSPPMKLISHRKLIKVLAAIHSKRANIPNDYSTIVHILHFKPNALEKIKLENILVKCREKFYKALNDALNHLLGKKEDKKFIRIPHELIVNNNLELNHKMLNMKMIDIFNDFNVDVSFAHKDKQIKNNNINEENHDYLMQIINMSFIECYDNYLKSQRYKEDYNNHKNTFGEKHAILYDYVAKIFISYYSLSMQLNEQLQNHNNEKNINYIEDINIHEHSTVKVIKSDVKS